MILSDRYRFLFIHIPKCAGTSVRNAVLPYHDADARFLKAVETHPELGPIDFRHLPLTLLRRLDPEAFAKLESYESYALIRDPYRRFRSAMAQRAKMYLGTEMAQLGTSELRDEICRVIDHLQSEPPVLAPEFIHFSRQSDFVQADGRRMVGNLFPVERLDLLGQALGRRIGAGRLEVGHVNQTTVFRHPVLKHLALASSAVAKRALPASAHRALRRSARRVLMKPTRSADVPVFDEGFVREFVARHYAEDIALHREVLADTAAAGAA